MKRFKAEYGIHAQAASDVPDDVLTFSKTLGDAECAWFAPPFPQFGAACPSFGIGLALGALSHRFPDALVGACSIALDRWRPSLLETIEARVAPLPDGWRVEAGGMRGRFEAPKPVADSCPRGVGTPMAFGHTDRILGCGLCGIAASTAMSRVAARAQGHADMTVPLHLLVRAALIRVAALATGPPVALRITGFPVTVGEGLDVHVQASANRMVVHFCREGETRVRVELDA